MKDGVFNKAIFKSTIEEWYRNPAVVGLSIVGFIYLMAFTICSVTFVDSPIRESSFASVMLTAVPAVALLGAGILGQDVAKGTLSVLFARPLRRHSYVLTRWLVLSISSSVLCLMLLVIEQIAGMAAFPGIMPDINTFYDGAARVSMCFGLSATFIMFSSILPHSMDLCAWILLCFSSSVVVEIGHLNPIYLTQPYGSELSRRLSEFVIPICRELSIPMQSLALPYLDVGYLFHCSSISWFAIFTYLSNIALCLLVAVFMVNRKEVSYAAK